MDGQYGVGGSGSWMMVPTPTSSFNNNNSQFQMQQQQQQQSPQSFQQTPSQQQQQPPQSFQQTPSQQQPPPPQSFQQSQHIQSQQQQHPPQSFQQTQQIQSQQQHHHQSLASHFHLLNLVEKLAEVTENGTRDAHSDALVNELTAQFEKCQQLLNSISASITTKAVTVEGQKRKLEETKQQLNQRRELISKYRSSVEDIVMHDT